MVAAGAVVGPAALAWGLQCTSDASASLVLTLDERTPGVLLLPGGLLMVGGVLVHLLEDHCPTAHSQTMAAPM